jgi:hypothetical protein
MGEHKHNPASLVIDTRPKCGSCVHFLADKPGSVHGACRAGPPMPAFGMRQGALGKVEEIVKSAWPPVTTDRWCGQHPDFMRWWSENREEITATLALNDIAMEGRA